MSTGYAQDKRSTSDSDRETVETRLETDLIELY